MKTAKTLFKILQVKPGNIQMLPTLYVFGIFGLKRSKYINRYMQYL